MKAKYFSIVAGVASLHLLAVAGLCLTGGCQSPEVLGQKGYIPAPEDGPPAAEEIKVDDSLVIKTPTETETFKYQETVKAPVAQELPPAPMPETIKYKVQRNDSFWSVSRKYGVGMEELASFNNMSLKKPLIIGQTLNIPPGGRLVPAAELKKAPVKSTGTRRKTSAKKASVKPEALLADGVYVVKSGDNPWVIARRYKVKTSALLKANGLTPQSVLQIGQKLIIPGASASTTTTAPSAPAATAPDAGQSTDDILNSVKDPAASAAPAPAAAPADNKEVLTAPATKDSGSSYVGTDTLTLPTDTTVEKIAVQYGIKVDDLKRLNPDLPKDGKLKAGTLLLLPDVK